MRAALALLLTGCIDWASLSPPFVPEGFGAVTRGGEGKPDVHVTNLNDSGPGSLREALGGSDRRIVFDVTGTIELASDLRFNGLANVTLEGGGITLHGGGLGFEGMSHDIIVKSVRVRDAPDDAFRVSETGSRIIFDHVSASGCTGGCIDITQTTRDVTIQWSLLRKTNPAVATTFIGTGAERITVHHTLYSGPEGNPEVNGGMADLRNNVILGDISARAGARVNVVGNWLEELVNEASQVFSEGNVGATANGTTSTAFAAPKVKTSPACEAARAVLAGAGTRPLDSADRSFVDGITLAGCP